MKISLEGLNIEYKIQSIQVSTLEGNKFCLILPSSSSVAALELNCVGLKRHSVIPNEVKNPAAFNSLSKVWQSLRKVLNDFYTSDDCININVFSSVAAKC